MSQQLQQPRFIFVSHPGAAPTPVPAGTGAQLFQSNAAVPVSTSPASMPAASKTFDIKVKILSTKGKRGGKTFALRGFEPESVQIPEDLEAILRSNFQSELGNSSGHFVSLGYMKSSTKVWIRGKEDVAEVMKTLKRSGDLTLWCSYANGPSKESESGSEEDEFPADPKHSKKRRRTVSHGSDSKEERISSIVCRLRGEHGQKYSAIQYRLWAEMIDVGTHGSHDSPPNVPMFYGASGHDGKKTTMATAVSELGTAIASAISGSHTRVDVSAGPPTGIDKSSQVVKAEVRSKYICQLKDLHDLLSIGAIESKDYENQKKLILAELSTM